MNALEDEYFANLRRLQVGHISEEVVGAHLTMRSVQIAGAFENGQDCGFLLSALAGIPWICH